MPHDEVRALVHDILTDDTYSYWLKDALHALADRDPDDARNDILLLAQVYDIGTLDDVF